MPFGRHDNWPAGSYGKPGFKFVNNWLSLGVLLTTQSRAMILSQPFNNDKQLNFEPIAGEVTAEVDDGLARGIFDTVAGHNIALYAEANRLTLQIDTTIWPFCKEALNICHQHSLPHGPARFDIASANGNFTIEYPETAKDQDYLAYIYTIWQSATMQQALLQKWHG